MSCPARKPGHCAACNRVVRWCDIQTCRPNHSEVPKSCHACRHAGPALRDSAGRVIGLSGSG